MVIGYPNAPAVKRRGAVQRYIPAEADQHATFGCAGSLRGRAIGGQRLRGRAEVKRDPTSHRDRGGGAVDADRLPAGDRGERQIGPPDGLASLGTKTDPKRGV